MNKFRKLSLIVVVAALIMAVALLSGCADNSSNSGSSLDEGDALTSESGSQHGDSGAASPSAEEQPDPSVSESASLANGDTSPANGDAPVNGDDPISDVEPVTIPLIGEVSLTADESKQSIALLDARDMQINYLQVISGDGKVLYQEALGYPHVGWNALFLLRLDDGDYLMRYNPYCGTGAMQYSFEVFSLQEDGTPNAPIATAEMSLDAVPGGLPINRDEIRAFVDAANQYLQMAELLASSDQDINYRLRHYFSDAKYINLNPTGDPESEWTMFYRTDEAPCYYNEYFYLTGEADMDLSLDERMDIFEQWIIGA